MNFGSASRDMGGFSSTEDEQQQQHMVMMRGKLPFSSYSSSPSSSSSSPQYTTSTTTASLVPSLAATPSPSWYNEGGGPDTRLELMDSSPRNTIEEDNRGGGESESAPIEREHMFDKVVTPSDVGKLNRLVIPKQHAEKYFPLDSSANEKGLLLNFEDRNGKPWRFRYSYWNSSQSYVMTKGWSRFVKEKKLDAGDIVSFQRGLGDLGKDHLYIDWRRRPDAPEPVSHHHPFHHHHPNFPIPPPSQHHLSFHPAGRSINPWSPLLMRPPGLPGRDHLHLSQQQQQQMNYSSLNIHHHYRNSGGGGFGGGSYGYGNVVNPVYYLRSAASSGGASPQFQHEHQQVQAAVVGRVEPMVLESVPVVQGKAAAKRLRLFGVNMDCPISESDEECDILSSTTIAAQPPLQLRLYDGTPLQHQQQPMSSSSSSTLITTDFLNRAKASAPSSSSMSLDFDM